MRHSNPLWWVGSLSVLLSACGGGGGSTAGSPSQTIPSVSTLQTTTQSNYPPSSVAHTVLSLINNERGQCHFGLLNQSTALDTASSHHAQYVVFNGFALGHEEATEQPFFSGLKSADQVKAAGYTFSTLNAQLVTIQNIASTVDQHVEATQAVRSLLSAPYHLSGMMFGARDIGMAQLRSVDVPNAPADRLVFNLFLGSAFGVMPQQGPDDQMSSYPCAGATGTQTGLFNENPNPIPNAASTTSLSAGQPVLIHAPMGQVLTVSAYKITDATGVEVSSALLTHANPQHNPNHFTADPNAQIAANEVVLLPLIPLAPNTQYHVVVSGTRKNGTAAAVDVQLDFSFTTGSGNAAPTL
jgi:uncharacterized protein YkwD